MPWPLPPRTRQLVGWLFLIGGALLLLGQCLRLTVLYYAYQRLGSAAISSVQLTIQIILTVTAILLLRYGWRERRGNDTVE